MSSNASPAFDPLKLAAEPPSGIPPEFTGAPLVERLFGISLSLATELAVTRERIDTIERLLEQRQLIQRREIDGFLPDPAVTAARAQAHQDYLACIFRVLLQDTGAAIPSPPRGDGDCPDRHSTRS